MPLLNESAKKLIGKRIEDPKEARIFILENQVKSLVEILSVVLPYVLRDNEEREFIFKEALINPTIRSGGMI